jgi:CRISPR-associated endonuclease/helicase Cas3
MTAIDLTFLIHAHGALPSDHSYALIGAVSRLIPEAHGGDGYALAPIAGRQIGGRQMKLTENSRFVVRTSPERIAQFLPLAGKTIDIFGRKISLGVPSVYSIDPAETLRARLVTIKGYFQPDDFKQAVQRQLDNLEIGDCEILVGRQRTLRIKRNEIVGFETTLANLAPEDSLKVSSHGIGGRRHMGCGFFVPASMEDSHGKS